MRFSFPLLFAFGALVSQVTARALQPAKRTTSDVCAEVSAGLTIPGLLGLPPITIGILNICLCLSGIPDLLHTNALVIALVDIVGVVQATAQITDMVNKASKGSKCTFPDHSFSVCSASDHCGFQCKDGFTPSPAKKPTDCVCLPPKVVCNGVCGVFKACPSGHPKRELEIQKRSASCDRGLTACGIYGWSGLPASQAWECIDTQRDLESCGGCAIPLTLGTPRGIDCTSIPGVADVSCSVGSCVVHRCLPGFVVSLDKTFCVRKGGVKFNGELPAAAAYGLEHLPLKRE
ncbi:unnamed protein product [Somion occarium]|uniref:Protein CPL1-like domain-containing protein n=1 Tax=Somion occarium TaxID=3059160 RepID=A0ABP1CF17_9APHY